VKTQNASAIVSLLGVGLEAINAERLPFTEVLLTGVCSSLRRFFAKNRAQLVEWGFFTNLSGTKVRSASYSPA